MLLCDAPEFERWRPDFSSSGQASPDWTRVVCAGEEVTNALEWIDWDELPVQVVLCEQCGISGCALGGRAQLSRLGTHVLWTAPSIDPERDLSELEDQPSTLLRRHGALAIPAAVWARWPGVPAIEALPPARRSDLLAAWHAAAPRREKAVAADGITLEDAFAVVDAVERWFESDAPAGELVPLGPDAITIFYEGARFSEWTPAARAGDRLVPVFAGRFMVDAGPPGRR